MREDDDDMVYIYADNVTGQLQKKYADAKRNYDGNYSKWTLEIQSLKQGIEEQTQLIADFSSHKPDNKAQVKAERTVFSDLFSFKPKGKDSFQTEIETAEAKKLALKEQLDQLEAFVEESKERVGFYLSLVDKQQKFDKKTQEIKTLYVDSKPLDTTDKSPRVKTVIDLKIEQSGCLEDLETVQTKIERLELEFNQQAVLRASYPKKIEELKKLQATLEQKFKTNGESVDKANADMEKANQALLEVDKRYGIGSKVASFLLLIFTFGFVKTKMDIEIEQITAEQRKIRGDQERAQSERSSTRDELKQNYMDQNKVQLDEKQLNKEIATTGLQLNKLLRAEKEVLDEYEDLQSENSSLMNVLLDNLKENNISLILKLTLPPDVKSLLESIKQFTMNPTEKRQRELIEKMMQDMSAIQHPKVNVLVGGLSAVYPEIKNAYIQCDEQLQVLTQNEATRSRIITDCRALIDEKKGGFLSKSKPNPVILALIACLDANAQPKPKETAIIANFIKQSSTDMDDEGHKIKALLFKASRINSDIQSIFVAHEALEALKEPKGDRPSPRGIEEHPSFRS